MHLEFMKFYGLKELAGSDNNPTIMRWVKDLGFDKTVLNDETAWCSLMINWLAWNLKLERSGKLNARSWLGVGINIPLQDAVLGDIVIFWRESIDSWKGHVGLHHGHDKKYIYVGGGNQNNQANTSPYHIDSPSHGFMACRRLRTLEEIARQTAA